VSVVDIKKIGRDLTFWGFTGAGLSSSNSNTKFLIPLEVPAQSLLHLSEAMV